MLLITSKIHYKNSRTTKDYCNQSGSRLQDPHIVLKSLVRQLSSIAYDTEHVQTKLMAKRKMAKDKGTDLSYKDCQELILDSTCVFSKTTLILDALDETDVTTHNLAETLIEIMQKSSKPVKIFISSRPECYESFKGWSTININVAEQITDIETFLEGNLYSHRDEFFQRRSQTIQTLIKDTFSKRHGGMFRWAYLQVQALKKCTTDGAIMNWSNKLPSGLMETYNQIWEDINKLDYEDSALAKRAIMWMMCTMRDMPVEGLLEAIRYVPHASTVSRIEAHSKQEVLSLCRNLLEIDVEQNKWTFPHASVPEYFESKIWPLEICDAFVSRASLGFLMNTQLIQELQERCGEYAKEFWHYRERFETRNKGERFFCVYALTMWPFHIERYDKWLGLNHGAHAEATELTAILKDFLGSPGKSGNQYLEWIDRLHSANYSGGVLSSLPYRVWRDYLGPSSSPLFTICQFGFFYVLHDWWLESQTIKQLALQEYDSKYRGPQTALTSAIEGDCMTICKYLLDLIDVNDPRANGHSLVLYNAIVGRKDDLFKFLVKEKNGDLYGSKRAYFSETAINKLLFDNRRDLFEWVVGTIGVHAPIPRQFVRYNWDPEHLYEYASLLINCAYQGRVWATEIVLKAGADVNFIAEWGRYGSALVAAAVAAWRTLKDKQHLIEMLLDHGADINLPLKAGNYGSALEASLVRSEEDETIPKLLLAAGADPTIISPLGPFGSAIARATYNGHFDPLKMMIEKVGKERAVKALWKSKSHQPPSNSPDSWKFDSEIYERRRKTVTYLMDEVGVGPELIAHFGFSVIYYGPKD